MRPASDLRADGSEVGSGAAPRRHLGLDGLRGLAVAWVVLFHLWPDAVPGGWLGVGLFFTLSGYLVVGLIDTEVSATGRLRLGRFMARRVRRLMPAALLTIASVLLSTAVLDDQALREVGFDALTAVLNVFNWRSALDTAGYAAIFDARPEPLAHFWSLAIEEQFYLLFPAAVALTRRTALVVWAMATAGLVGVVLWWGSTDAYVATPVRGLEIAAGAGLALAAARLGFVTRLMEPDPRRDRAREQLGRAAPIAGGVVVAAAVGATVVALARLGPQDSLVFRGGPQLMALCWVVLIVAAVRDGIMSRLMAVGILRWLGTRSYAIYLFHWPLIELTDQHPFTVIAATLIAAEASYRLVEMPVRLGSGQRALALLGAAAVAVALIAAAMAVLSDPARAIGERAEGADELPAWTQENPDDSPTEGVDVPDTVDGTEGVDVPDTVDEIEGVDVPEASPTDSAAPTSSAPSPPSSPQPTVGTTEPESDSPVTTTSGPAPAEAPLITVLGDSTGTHIADGLRRWADAIRSMAVVDRSQVGCYPLEEDEPGAVWRVVQDNVGAFGWNPGDEACRTHRIEPESDIVLVVHHGSAQFERQRADGSWASILDQQFAAGVSDYYRRLVDEARSLGSRVAFTSAPPLLPVFGVGPEPDPERADVYNSLLRSLVAEFRSLGLTDVSLIDTAAELEASGHDGRYSRSDGLHLDFDQSAIFAAEVLGPALLELLNE